MFALFFILSSMLVPPGHTSHHYILISHIPRTQRSGRHSPWIPRHHELCRISNLANQLLSVRTRRLIRKLGSSAADHQLSILRPLHSYPTTSRGNSKDRRSYVDLEVHRIISSAICLGTQKNLLPMVNRRRQRGRPFIKFKPKTTESHKLPRYNPGFTPLSWIILFYFALAVDTPHLLSHYSKWK